MKVLIACEESGVVRRAFRALGHDAYSCDLLPSRDNSEFHIKDDAHNVAGDCAWDLIIAHPPCDYLTVANNGHMANGCSKYSAEEGMRRRGDAQEFFLGFLHTFSTSRVCIENPVGIMSSFYRQPDQIIQPYQFGSDASKKTCLWLKGLPKLIPTKFIEPRIVNGKRLYANQTDSGQNNLAPGKNRKRDRSETYPGIAQAMAEQWGSL